MYAMTHTLQFQVQQSETLLEHLDNVTNELTNAIETENHARMALQELESMMSAAEAELVVEAEFAAKEKSGPLSGLAKTGKAYGYALEAYLHEQRTSGRIADLYRQVQDARREYEAAKVRREQAAVRFSAAKRAAELRAAMLKALSV